MSIFHRLTGIILTSAPLILVGGLSTIIWGPETYTEFYTFLHLTLSQVYIFLLCASFYYHLCHGMRHLIWDLGYGFDLKVMKRSGWLALMLSFVLTAFTWFSLKGYWNV